MVSVKARVDIALAKLLNQPRRNHLSWVRVKQIDLDFHELDFFYSKRSKKPITLGLGLLFQGGSPFPDFFASSKSQEG